MIDVDAIKQQFPIFASQLNQGRAFHYLDSAATAQKPQQVLDAITQCYSEQYGPVARGLYPLAEQATHNYEAARGVIAEFIGAKNDNIIFTRSATESINMVAEGYVKATLQEGDEVWVSVAEHHANYLPWLRVCNETGATLRTLNIDENGKLVLPPLNELKSGKVKCIALSLISNVLGYYADVPAITQQAKAAGITTVIDACQVVAHHSVDVEDIQCDFLAFSGHKMFGPTGIGVLYAAKDKLNALTPFILGGGMVDWVGETLASTEWTPGVAAHEAGSPNLAGAIGIAEAAKFVMSQDLDALENHLSELAVTCGNTIKELPGYIVFGDESNWQAGIITFSHETAHPHDIAQICGDRGVAIRAGHHCAQPLMKALGHPATARVSFSIYNQQRDIEALVMSLVEAQEMFA